MNYRNLRHLIEGDSGLGARRLVLSIEGDEGGEAGGGAPAAEVGAAGDAGDGEGGDAGETGAGEAAPAPAAEAGAPAGAEGGGDPPAEAAPKPTRVPWQTKRIDSLTAQAKTERELREAAETTAAETRRQLAAYQALYGTDALPPGTAAPAVADPAPAGGKSYTEAEFNAAVENRARLSSLDTTLETWYNEGVATGGDAFKAKMQGVGQAFGPDLAKRVDFFEAVASLPNGKAVYEGLAGDLDHFADVLAMSPLQLGLELGKLSTAAAAKPAARGPAVSKAPAPITPIDGNAGAVFDADTAPMEDYVADYEARRKRRFEERGY